MSKALELADDLEKHWNTQAPLAVAAELRRLAAEVQQLTEERTAWRVTAENAEAAVKQARIDAQAQSCVPAVKATDQRVTFDTWLRSVCLQAPPDHAQDLARSAWYASDKQASADCEAMAEEIERLQKALAFWMPDVPSTDHPLYKRVANDVYLLVGFDGPNPEPSAFELGHVVLAESQPTLWAIHVPGPDDYYPSPSEEAANHMASKHNAAMTEWFKENPDTSGNRPPIESSLASAKQWPGSAADHAEEIAVFDYAAWGLASPQPQPVQPSGQQYLCKAWGETDLPAAAIVSGLDGVRAFLVEQWLGDADHEHDDGTKALPEAMADMQTYWATEGECWFAEFEIGGVSVQKVFHAPPKTVAQAKPEQAAQPTEIHWPRAKDVGRYGDMSPSAHMRVGLDNDNDAYVSVWDENGGGSVEFCNGGSGGGASMKTRLALIALMVAMEEDNAARPDKDWWARRAAGSAAPQPKD